MISINAGLTRRDIVVLAAMIGSGATTLITGGYVFWPAKSEDVDKIRQDLVVIARDIGEIKATVAGMSLQFDELRSVPPVPRRPLLRPGASGP